MYSSMQEHAGQLTTNVMVSIQNCVKPTAPSQGVYRMPYCFQKARCKKQRARGT